MLEGDTVEVNTVVAVIGGPPSAGGTSGAGDRAFGARTEQPTTAVQSVPAARAAEPADGRKIRSSPLVRKIAQEHGVNLAVVAGTGSEGRITKEDILAFLAKRGSTAHGRGLGSWSADDSDAVVPMTKMRAIIAQRMVGEQEDDSARAHGLQN